jgi:uncharacterized protein YaiL (DUF2058 family)
MSDSLRDQLLSLGFKPAPKPEKTDKPAGAQKPGHMHARKDGPRGHDGKGRGGRPPHSPGGANAGERDRERQGERRPPRHDAGRPGQQAKPQHTKKPRTQEEIDLAKAYAIRAQREKEERIEAERLKQEEARKRREAKAKLAELVKDQGLNDPNAEIARHFPYGGKIKRIYVNEAQLKQLNGGELGVIQLDGRYLLVTAALLAEAEAVFAPAVALKVDPNAPAEDDPYADPQYQVPDDLVW